MNAYNFKKMFPSMTELLGGEKWLKYHQGLAGRPDCVKCHGEGWYFIHSGPDDYDKENCTCLK